jgi:hypothetical protein
VNLPRFAVGWGAEAGEGVEQLCGKRREATAVDRIPIEFIAKVQQGSDLSTSILSLPEGCQDIAYRSLGVTLSGNHFARELANEDEARLRFGEWIRR